MTTTREATIADVRPATAVQWDAFACLCDHATFFHSRSWARAWATTDKTLTAAAKLVTFEDGRRAVIPRTVRRNPGGVDRSFVARDAVGGWLTIDDLVTGHAEALVEYLRDLDGEAWRLNPLDPMQARFADARAAVSDLRRSPPCSRTPSADIHIRTAGRCGDWRAYAALPTTAQVPWGLLETLRSNPGVRLSLAEASGEVIGGIVCLSTRLHLACWHRAGTASELLIRHAMATAAARGIRWFDRGPR